MRADLAHIAHTSAIYTVVQGADGDLLSGGGDGMVLAWNQEKGDMVRAVASVPSPVQALRILGDLLLIGTAAGELFVIDLGSKKVLHRLAAHTKGIYAIAAIGPDRIACAGGDGTLSLWQLHGPGMVRCEVLRTIPLCDAKLRGLAVSAHGDRLAVACGDGAVRVLETGHFNEMGTCTGHVDGANAVAFHPTKPVLVSGGKDGHIRVWDSLANYRELLSFAAHRSTIYQLAFDPDSLRCASASRDKTAKLWDAHTFNALDRLDVQHGGHTHSVNAVCWLGGELFTGGDDRKLIRWTDP